jgi:hypothetical protein
MKHLELHRFKKAIGAVTFGLFFPNENKKLDQKHGVGKQSDLVLVFVPEGKQTVTAGEIRKITGWTVKKSTAFVKEGDYPKVVVYNAKQEALLLNVGILEAYILKMKTQHEIIFEIY